MASSNIKLFDENKGNMLSDSEFSISNQRMNGLQTGVASSQLQNKAMYQASLVAYAIAQIMMQNGLNANDTDAVSAFVANLSGTMLQKVYDIATTAEAQAGVATGKWMSPALVKAAIDKTLTDKNYLQKSGGTMTGNLILNANPTANLGAATKQYVDTQVNNAKTALTPVFGDLAKNGWFKLGNFTKNSTVDYVYSDIHSFLSNNIGKVTELAIVLKNIKLVNTASSTYALMAYNSKQASGEAGVMLASVSGGTTATVNKIIKMNVLYTSYVNASAKSFNIGNVTGEFTIVDSSVQSNKDTLHVYTRNTYLEIASGTMELWYK